MFGFFKQNSPNMKRIVKNKFYPPPTEITLFLLNLIE